MTTLLASLLLAAPAAARAQAAPQPVDVRAIAAGAAAGLANDYLLKSGAQHGLPAGQVPKIAGIVCLPNMYYDGVFGCQVEFEAQRAGGVAIQRTEIRVSVSVDVNAQPKPFGVPHGSGSWLSPVPSTTPGLSEAAAAAALLKVGLPCDLITDKTKLCRVLAAEAGAAELVVMNDETVTKPTLAWRFVVKRTAAPFGDKTDYLFGVFIDAGTGALIYQSCLNVMD